MTHHFIAKKPTFWIAHSEESLSHGVLETGETLDSGQPYLETYTSPREWSRRLAFLQKDYAAALSEWLETLRLQEPRARLADYRWRRETGGITLTTGIGIRTDRTSQAQLTSMVTALSEKLIQEPVQWKTDSGWITLTRLELKQVAKEVTGHVRKCFSAEERVAMELEQGSVVDIEAAFETAYLEA